MEIVRNLVQCLFSGFQITVIVLFILKLIFKKHYLLWRNLFLLSNCILLFTSLVYGVVYLTELYRAWFSQVTYEQQAFKWRIMGPYWWSYWMMILIPFVLPQILWFKKLRRSYLIALFLSIIFFITGPLFEMFVVLMTSSYKGYLPSSWTYYGPAFFEIIMSFLIFSVLLLLVYFVCRKKLTLIRL